MQALSATRRPALRTGVGARGEHGVVLKQGADAGQVQLVHLLRGDERWKELKVDQGS